MAITTPAPAKKETTTAAPEQITVTCYNYYQQGHYANKYSKPRKSNYYTYRSLDHTSGQYPDASCRRYKKKGHIAARYPKSRPEANQQPIKTRRVQQAKDSTVLERRQLCVGLNIRIANQMQHCRGIINLGVEENLISRDIIAGYED